MTWKLFVVGCCGLVVAGIVPAQSAPDPVRIHARSVAPNDCLPAAMKVYHELPSAPTCSWKRLLSARYGDARLNHVYCVFAVGEQLYAYDSVWGSRRIYAPNRSATALARAVDFSATHGVYLN